MEHTQQGPQTACFVISVAARLLNVHPQTLRYYERAGLIAPSRSKGNIRLYSPEDVQRAMQIKRFIEDFGVNLAGVEVIMRLTDRLRDQEQELTQLRARLESYDAERQALRGRRA